jgi:hypothetical protein
MTTPQFGSWVMELRTVGPGYGSPLPDQPDGLNP